MQAAQRSLVNLGESFGSPFFCFLPVLGNEQIRQRVTRALGGPRRVERSSQNSSRVPADVAWRLLA